MTTPIRLPKSLKFPCHTVYVSVKKKARLNGQYYPATGYLEVAVNGRKPKQVSQTMWHETTHAVLANMKHRAANVLVFDEAFVDEFATVLNNALHSAKY